MEKIIIIKMCLFVMQMNAMIWKENIRFMSFIVGILQAACDEDAEKYERAFVLQLLASGGSGGSKEVLILFFLSCCWY